MTIEKRVVFVSPDGQFHESEEAAIEYVKRVEIERRMIGIISTLLEESCDGNNIEDARVLTTNLMEHFNITTR